MSSLKLTLCFVVTVLAILTIVHSQTNCGVGSADCDKCGANSTILQSKGRDLKVCCGSCSSYYRTGYSDEVHKSGPFCTCDFDNMHGNCWKGDICKTCGHGYVSYFNGMPLCCQNCEKSGRELSLTSCNCVHNGP